MKIINEKMPMNNNLLNKLNNICIFNNLKLEIINGIVFKVKDMNINFIEPHRFVISINDIKLILLCYDNKNICLYDKENLINISILRELIVSVKGEINNG